jgi:hypothetical protein
MTKWGGGGSCYRKGRGGGSCDANSLRVGAVHDDTGREPVVFQLTVAKFAPCLAKRGRG